MSEIGAALRRLVIERTYGCCENCWMPIQYDELPGCVDHVISLKQHGPTIADNLAGDCFHDNSCKGTELTGIDSGSGLTIRLYNPRSDVWPEHFLLDRG